MSDTQPNPKNGAEAAKAESLVNSVTKKTVISVALVFTAVIGSLFFYWFTSKHQTDNSEVINVAGRQRMLSQKITKAALGHAQNVKPKQKADYIAELQSTLKRFNEGANALDRNNHILNMKSLTGDEIFALEQQVNTLRIRLSELTQQYIDNNDPSVLEDLHLAERLFLPRMDSLVNAYSKSSSREFSNLSIVVISSYILILVVVLFEWRFIFRPLTGTIRQSFNHLVKTQKELEKSTKEAQAASTAKSAFLATMSHEIRTPMNAVIGMTSLLSNTNLDSEQTEQVEIIQTSSDALLALINDILDFSKIEAEGIDLEEETFSLDNCITSALEIVHKKAQEKQLELAYEINPDAPSQLKGDATRIRQILINLLGNAVKFTASGSVVLNVNCKKLQDTNYRLICNVEDTGIGMTQEEQAKLFQPFMQADSSTTRKFGGTGLGLSISKRLAEMMKGKLSCQSVIGKGSTFTLDIPIESEPSATRIYERVTEIDLADKHIVFVDDNATNLKLFRAQAEAWGMNVTTYDHPKLAIDKMKELPKPDVIVSDFLMPDFDGIGFAELYKAIDKTTPILLISSVHLNRKDTPDGLFASVSLKPIKTSTLHNRICEVLGKSSLKETSSSSLQGRNEIEDNLAQEHPLSILVAEDNPVNAKVISQILKKMGYTADYVQNGKQAFQAICKTRFDLVLMDVEMPVLSGIDSTKAIREQGDSIDQPFISALTANAFNEQKQNCLNAGMNEYLMKPIQVKELTRVIKSIKPNKKVKPEKTIAEDTPPSQPKQDLLNHSHIDILVDEPYSYESIIAGFGNELEADLLKLEKSIDTKDDKLARESLHRMIGATGNLGLSALCDIFSRLHIDIHENNKMPKAESLEKIKKVSEDTLKALVVAEYVHSSFSWQNEETELFSQDEITQLSTDPKILELSAELNVLTDTCLQAISTGQIHLYQGFANKLLEKTTNTPLEKLAQAMIQHSEAFDINGLKECATVYVQLIQKLKEN